MNQGKKKSILENVNDNVEVAADSSNVNYHPENYYG
jgi:hypothetical protein